MIKKNINNIYLSCGVSGKSFIFVFIFLFAIGISIGHIISINKNEFYKLYTSKQNNLIHDQYTESKFEELTTIDIDKTQNNLNQNSLEKSLEQKTKTINEDYKKEKTIIFAKKKFNRNQPTWKKNALHFVAEKNIPMIAIIIDDMGLDIIRSNKILDINAPLTTSYMAYAINLQNQIANAQNKGKEIMLHVPMEAKSESYEEGPDVLKTSYSKDLLQKIILKQIQKSDKIVGINNHMGSKFTENFAAMNTILEPVKNSGLIFIDSKTSQKSVGAKVAKIIDMPHATRDIFLDHYPEESEIEQQLKMLESFAKRKGYAIAIGHPRDNTINVLKRWLENVQSRGFQIVPITTIIKHINQ